MPSLHRLSGITTLNLLLLLMCAFTAPKSDAAATFYSNCFSTKGVVNAVLNYDVNASDNHADSTITALTSYEVPADAHPAQCGTCPGVASNTKEKIYSYKSTPLPLGSIPKYGKLTDKIDIKITAYTDTVAGGSNQSLIETYPLLTPTTSMPEPDNNEATQTLCAKNPVASSPQRQFNWNKLSASLHIASPILGVETIPNQILMETSVCIYYGTGSCTFANATLASTMYISGAISAPLSCTINAGSVINVDFNTLPSMNFTAKGEPPVGFALRDVDITFHCDNAAVSNSDKIKLTLSSDQGVSDTGTALIAKMIGRDDIGVRMYDSNSNGVPLDGSVSFPITLDSSGNGHIKMSAAPVATTNAKPTPGKFEGNVTVKMDIR